MDTLSMRFGIVQRSAGGDARKIAAYQMCARLSADGRKFDFSRKRAEHRGRLMLMPPGAPAWAQDPQALWDRAEAAERRGDAQSARLLEFSIPRAVPEADRTDFVRHVLEPFAEQKMGVQADLHTKKASDGQEHPHVHVMLTLREFDGDDFAKKKTREWNTQFRDGSGTAVREQVAQRMNSWMEAHGITERLDHRSRADRGISGPPTERNISKKAFHAFAADANSEAAAPVRALLAQRKQRKQALRKLEQTTEHEGAHYARPATNLSDLSNIECMPELQKLAALPTQQQRRGNSDVLRSDARDSPAGRLENADSRMFPTRGERRDAAAVAARAAYAAAASTHYESIRKRQQVEYQFQRDKERDARDMAYEQRRAERSHAYKSTNKGLVRGLSLAVATGRHNRRLANINVNAAAARMTSKEPAIIFPGFDEWLDERAASGDVTAKAALAQRQASRAWLAQKDPTAAARRNVDDVKRAADRVLHGRPRGSVDEQELFLTTRNRIAERCEQAAAKARAAQATVAEHKHGAGFLRRMTDTGWRDEHAQLTAAAGAAQQQADRIASRHNNDMKVAKEAARQAANTNRRVLAAWLARPDVQAAQAARAAAERVRAAVDTGDADTIKFAAGGNLPAAARAARAAETRQADEERRQREQQEAEQAAEREAMAIQQATAATAAEAAKQARRRRDTPVPSAAPAYHRSSPGLPLAL